MEVKPGYKHTEVGVIPEDWDLDYIENLANITTGGRNTQDRVDDGQYPFFVRSQTVEHINSYSFDGEAVLTAGDGVGTGKVFHYIVGKFDAHQRVYRISEFNERIKGYFFFLYFSSHFYSRIMQMTAKSSVDSVRREMIARMIIPLPPTKAEQSAIAAVLSDADALIAGLDRLIAKKRDIKQAAMQELLTGKKRLPGFADENQYKRTEVGLVPENWTVKSIGSILNKGKLGGNYSNQDKETHYPLIKMGNIGRGSIDLGKIEYISDGIIPNEMDRLRYGDLLFNTRNTLDLVGKVAIWRNELPIAYFNSNLMRLDLKPEEIASTFYANYAFNSTGCIARLKSIATGTTSVAAIYTRDLLKIPFPCPPLPEQQAIAAVLSDMDTEIAALEARREKTRALKQGMMQELLTGRIRLV